LYKYNDISETALSCLNEYPMEYVLAKCLFPAISRTCTYIV